MADFTAVIRRAVEGLPEQSPELRARVYDKARSAVIRQMENMNPPPPEAMIKRQIDKIDAAIAEVESDFTVAMPSDEPEEDVFPQATFHDDEPAVDDQPVHEAEAPAEDYEDPAPAPSAPDYAEDEPYDDAPAEPEEQPAAEPRSMGFLQGATFEAVNRPDRVVFETMPDPDEDQGYSFDRPEDEESEAGSVVVESDEDDEPRPADDWQFEAAPAATPGYEPPAAAGSRSVSEKDWAHVDSLLGLEPDERGFDEDDRLTGAGRHDDDDGFEEEKSGSGKRIALAVGAVVLVAVIAVGGYFAYENRDSLMAPGDAVTETETPADTTATPPDAETEAEPATETAGAPATTAPESEEGGTEKQFTQRLLPDGTEVDEGLPAAGENAGPARSVASQTAGSTAPASAGQDTADPAPPVGAAQKMYLYEEQLGQTVPSAFQGTVTWELKQENNGTAVSEPVIEGVMNVPDAGLSGVVTFRRNDDSSLPASHLIDISFTLGDNFQGGAVDNVQRMSLKNTEASRGDPLIAVSAKITDDLYMLALNDFDQARGQNMALLAERNWIDIPVTYRNGRRALLTLEKGTTGMAIFDRAVQEWQALGDIGDNNN